MRPRVFDTTGKDIYPFLADAAAQYDLPIELILACAKAESNLNPDAFRDDGPMDTSVGPFQQVVIYAKDFGIGDGLYTPSNIATCRSAFTDWNISTRIACEHLHSDRARVILDNPALTGDEVLLGILSCYNSGHPQPLGNWWWVSEQHANYTRALQQARMFLLG